MKNSKTLSIEIQEQINARIKAFNDKTLSKSSQKYGAQFKGKFIYLGFTSDGQEYDPVCRLTYNGNIDDLDFAIYKYSTEKYDPNEWFFPGSEFVDSTLEGAMKAGLKAY